MATISIKKKIKKLLRSKKTKQRIKKVNNAVYKIDENIQKRK